MISFHRFLIATGIVFCFGFAAWEAVAFAGDGGVLPLVLAIVFTGFGAALIVYLRRLNRFLGYERGNRR